MKAHWWRQTDQLAMLIGHKTTNKQTYHWTQMKAHWWLQTDQLAMLIGHKETSKHTIGHRWRHTGDYRQTSRQLLLCFHLDHSALYDVVSHVHRGCGGQCHQNRPLWWHADQAWRRTGHSAVFGHHVVTMDLHTHASVGLCLSVTEKSSKSKIAWHISDGDTVIVLAVHLKPSETEYYSLNYLMFNYNELWRILSNKYMCKQKKKGSFNTRNLCFSLINCCFSRFMLIESVICFLCTVTTINV